MNLFHTHVGADVNNFILNCMVEHQSSLLTAPSRSLFRGLLVSLLTEVADHKLSSVDCLKELVNIYSCLTGVCALLDFPNHLRVLGPQKGFDDDYNQRK